MKIIENVKPYEVMEADFEALRLLLNEMGENYSPAYFHGVAGTAFRIGGICPCAPTCTTAVSLEQLITTFGYEYRVLPFTGETDVEVTEMIRAVCESIDNQIPALVWNAFTPCEWNLVTGYDEQEQVFYGRGPWRGGSGEYAKESWYKAKEEAGMTGMLAVIIIGKNGMFQAEAECLQKLLPLLSWSSPWGADAERNAEVYPHLKAAYDAYVQGVEQLASAVECLECYEDLQ